MATTYSPEALEKMNKMVSLDCISHIVRSSRMHFTWEINLRNERREKRRILDLIDGLTLSSSDVKRVMRLLCNYFFHLCCARVVRERLADWLQKRRMFYPDAEIEKGANTIVECLGENQPFTIDGCNCTLIVRKYPSDYYEDMEDNDDDSDDTDESDDEPEPEPKPKTESKVEVKKEVLRCAYFLYELCSDFFL